MCILSFDYTARQLELGGESADAAPFCQHRELTENKLFQHRELTEDELLYELLFLFSQLTALTQWCRYNRNFPADVEL